LRPVAFRPLLTKGLALSVNPFSYLLAQENVPVKELYGFSTYETKRGVYNHIIIKNAIVFRGLEGGSVSQSMMWPYTVIDVLPDKNLASSLRGNKGDRGKGDCYNRMKMKKGYKL
jgi:hypothetical protein